MEAIVSNVNVYDISCIGCLRHERDIMITMSTPGEGEHNIEFNDFFLTTAQAIQLRDEIDEKLKSNKSENMEEVEKQRSYYKTLKANI